MKTILIYIYYYIGHLTYLLGLKYWYIPGAYTMYSYFMCKSERLDTEGVVWGKSLPAPEKDGI